ncbi:MAG TPA: DUF2934 domain-containing protein [Blastocatellia bacterium]|nr:DUF2934 domain-containing protein [Blastocatellia bacterium]
MKELNVEQLRERLPAEREVQEAVSLRAYEIYQSRGQEYGHDLDDWLQAENEVLAALTEPKAHDLAVGSAKVAVEIGDTGQTQATLAEAASRKGKG